MPAPTGGQPVTTPFNRQVISDIFGQQPELAFLGFLEQQGLRPQQNQLLRSRASDFLNRFQQAVGSQLAGGQLPTLTPQQFFGGLDFRNELAQLTPQERGIQSSRFAPRTRFFF